MRSNVLCSKIETLDVSESKWAKYKYYCSVEGCEKQRQHRGLCLTHLNEDPDAPRCSFDDCTNAALGGPTGLCATHRSQLKRYGETWPIVPHANKSICKAPLCARNAQSKLGYCRAHTEQWNKHGEVWPIRTRKGAWTKNAKMDHCVEDGCQEPVFVWGRCLEHAVGELGECWLRGCPNPASHKRTGLCDTHARRERAMRMTYGIGWQKRQEMAEAQDHVCRICGKPDDPLEDPLHIDHDHHTGKLRGLLCGPCNRGIGLFDHDTKHLRAAIEYLEVTD